MKTRLGLRNTPVHVTAGRGYQYRRPGSIALRALAGFGVPEKVAELHTTLDPLMRHVQHGLELQASLNDDGWDNEEPARNLGLERWQDRTFPRVP